MIFRNLDASHDWQFGHGLSNYITDDAAIGLNIETRILSWVNDCFFDLNAGIDWLNRLGATNQRTLLETDLRRIILQSYGVVGITAFSSNLSSRAFAASYAVDTIFGTNYKNTLTQDLQNA